MTSCTLLEWTLASTWGNNAMGERDHVQPRKGSCDPIMWNASKSKSFKYYNVYDYECKYMCECEWTDKKRCEWVIGVDGQGGYPLLYYLTPLWEWMHKEKDFSLSTSLSCHLSLSFSHVEPPWEGGGIILGTTPHPALLINISIVIAINPAMLNNISAIITFIINPSSSLTLFPSSLSSLS